MEMKEIMHEKSARKSVRSREFTAEVTSNRNARHGFGQISVGGHGA